MRIIHPLNRLRLPELPPANPPQWGFAEPIGGHQMKLRDGCLLLQQSVHENSHQLSQLKKIEPFQGSFHTPTFCQQIASAVIRI